MMYALRSFSLTPTFFFLFLFVFRGSDKYVCRIPADKFKCKTKNDLDRLRSITKNSGGDYQPTSERQSRCLIWSTKGERRKRDIHLSSCLSLPISYASFSFLISLSVCSSLCRSLSLKCQVEGFIPK